MIVEPPMETQVETCKEFLLLAATVQIPDIASYTLKGAIQMLNEARTPREEVPTTYISDIAVELAAEQLGIPVNNGYVGISKKWFNPIDEKRRDASFRAKIRELGLTTFEEIIELVKTYEEPITL